MLQQQPLQLGWRHLKPLVLNQLLLAVQNPHAPAPVHPHNIPRMQPAVRRYRLSRSRLVIVIPLHHLRPPHQQLPYLALSHVGIPRVQIHHPQLRIRRRSPHRTRRRPIRLDIIYRSHRRQLRHPIRLKHRKPARRLNPRLQILRRRRRRQTRRPHRRQVIIPKLRIQRQPDPHRRHRVQLRNLMRLHQPQHLLHIEPPHQHLRPARRDNRIHQHLHPVYVKQRQMRQQNVILSHLQRLPRPLHKLPQIRRQIIMRQHHPLGQPRSPA